MPRPSRTRCERAGRRRWSSGRSIARDAARLVGATEESIALEELYRESGGNPFYLLQLARDRAHDRAVAAPDWTDVRGVPAAVRASIGRELDGLPAPARAFAQAAAVAGDQFDLDLAVPAAAMPERDALAALDELIAREILRPGDAPRRFRFRHPLVREAIYAGSPPGTRLVCHERTAAALEAQGAPAIVRAGGGDELPLIPGGFRANFLEILTRSWLACGRRAGPVNRQGRAALGTAIRP